MVGVTRKRLPSWLKRKLPGASTKVTRAILEQYRVNTVCESALCPNCGECFSQSTATFMILGRSCTRRCGFCAVESGAGEPVCSDEPERVARAAKAMRLRYVVVTSVTRDDLADEGAGQFAETVRAIRCEIPETKIEVLTPDFHARRELIARVSGARPDVFNHNLETVARLQRDIRPQADYDRSLRVLSQVKEICPELVTKSGLMAGLGETDAEMLEAAADLRKAGCDILTIGQYLSPGPGHWPVAKYKTPPEFEELGKVLRGMGFRNVFSGPWVRSSYQAGEVFRHSESIF